MVLVMEPGTAQAGQGMAPAADVLTGLRFAVVDIETSGLRAERHQILQVAVVGVDAEGHELDRWVSYARPPRWPLARVGPRRVHGIRRRDVRRAAPLFGVLQEAASRVEGAVFTAHNAAFDLGFLRHHARALGITWPQSPEVCTLALSRALDPDRTMSHRLGEVCARNGITVDRPHDALADATATAEVLPHLIRAAGISTWTALAGLGRPQPQ
jgi:DNA polymerase-3 subunit epsilon